MRATCAYNVVAFGAVKQGNLSTRFLDRETGFVSLGKNLLRFSQVLYVECFQEFIIAVNLYVCLEDI